jgi:hypothetical protein
MKHDVNKLIHLVDGKGAGLVPLGLLGSSTEMDFMKRLKHIRRELDVILRVVTEQRNVIEQLSELITPTGRLQASPKCPMGENAAELAKQRFRKLEKRKNRIEALDAKAGHIFNDVSRFTRREITVLWLILKVRKLGPAERATGPDFPSSFQ